MPIETKCLGALKDESKALCGSVAQVQAFLPELGKDVAVKMYTLVQTKGLLFLFLWSFVVVTVSFLVNQPVRMCSNIINT